MPLRRSLALLFISVFGLVVMGGCGGTTSSSSSSSSAAAPTIASLSPSSAQAGSVAFSLTVTGTGFAADATVQWNGSQRSTTVVSATQLTASISAADVATAGSAQVTVTGGGKTSGASAFTIGAALNPVPVIASLSPLGATAGGPAFTLTVNGTGFVAGSTVQWNGAARTTTFVSATRITAAVAAADIASAGSAAVTVVTPAPGGGTSAAATFTISPPPPSLSSLSPATATAGGPAFTLTVNGSGFQSGAAVAWNGAARPTTFVSATQVTAAIPASDIASAGTVAVDVIQSGVHAVATLPFTVNRTVAAPTIASLNPTSVYAGAGAFTLTVNGTGFTSSSVVSWNGSRLATTFLTATQLGAAVTADLDVATATASIVVTNPSEQGGVSSSASFNVSAAPTGKIVQIVSKNYLNGSPSGGTWDHSSVSKTGRYVAYMAYASDLVPGDTNGDKDGFVTDTCAGVTTGCTPSTQRVSVDTTGAEYPYGGVSAHVLLSGDGRYALYDRNNDTGTEIRDTCAGATGCTRSTLVVYANANNNPPDNNTICCSRYSADGRYVFSSRFVPLPGSTSGIGLYVTDTCIGAAAGCTPFSQRVGLGKTGTPPRQSFQEDISSGGRYVLFRTTGNLIDPALSTTTHVFLEDTCIGAPAGCTVTDSMIDVRLDGTESDGNGPNDAAADAESSFSADGRYVMFASTDPHMFPGRTITNASAIYLRDTCIGAPAGCTPSTILVSMDETNASIRAYKGYRAVSEHGRYVAYMRVPVGGVQDSIRVRDTCVGAPAGCVPSTSTASVDPDGVNPGSTTTSYLFPSLSADGHYVTFTGSSSTTQRIQQVFLALSGY